MKQKGKMPRSLAEAMPQEQARVRAILKAYHEIGPAGTFGAATIEQALCNADRAVASGDVLAVLRAYHELTEIKE